MIATLAPVLGGGQRGALAREAGADDQDVVCWHGSVARGRRLRRIYNARRCRASRRRPRLQRLADLGERHDAPQDAVARRRRPSRPRRPRPSAPQQRFERLPPRRSAPAGPASSTSADRQRRASGGDLRVDALLAHDAEEVARRVDDREPRPAVAQEELLLGVEQRQLGRDRDGLAVHDVGDRDALDALADRPLRPRPRRRLVEEEREQHREQAERCRRRREHANSPSSPSASANAWPARPVIVGGAVAVAGAPPDQRAGDPPAVEREGGDRLNTSSERVDRTPSQPSHASAGVACTPSPASAPRR